MCSLFWQSFIKTVRGPLRFFLTNTPRSHLKSYEDNLRELVSLSVKLYSISKCILPYEATLHFLLLNNNSQSRLRLQSLSHPVALATVRHSKAVALLLLI